MKIAVGTALAGLVLFGALSGPASAQEWSSPIIGQLAAKATEIYKGKGYSPTAWSKQARLGDSVSQDFSIRLDAQKEFSLVGMCDTNCSNLDMLVIDSNGKVVGSDVEADDFPIVSFTPSAEGNYTVRITMTKCTSTCDLGIMAFKRD